MKGAVNYLKMKTDSDVINSDLQEIGAAAKKLASDAIKLGSLGFGTTFLQYFASFAAIYLLILDRTNWRTNMLTALLIPYIYLTLPSFLFSLVNGEIGHWIAFVAVVLRLFFPKHVPEWGEMAGALILLVVVTPSLLADHVRGSWIGIAICLVIGCYLLHEHIKASGGFKNAFTKTKDVFNSIGIILLFAYPVWALVLAIL